VYKSTQNYGRSGWSSLALAGGQPDAIAVAGNDQAEAVVLDLVDSSQSARELLARMLEYRARRVI